MSDLANTRRQPFERVGRPTAHRCECPRCGVHSMIRYGSASDDRCANCGATGLTHIGFAPLYRALQQGGA